MCFCLPVCGVCECGDIKEVPYLPEKDSRTPPPRFPSQSWVAVIFPGADCHQSSTIPPWPMCATIQVQTATSHQPFHPAYVCHYPGADCHQSSTIPPGLCVSLSRGRLPPVINHSTLAYVCHYPGADCHQSSTIPPWPMCATIQGQTATSHQPFHPGLCVSLSRCRLPPVINHSTLTYVCHYPGADCHQSSTIPPWPMCVTIQVQTATSHQPFHPDLCVSLSRAHLSRLWFTKQSLKGVGHEGTPCLKGEQRHPPCPSKVPLS